MADLGSIISKFGIHCMSQGKDASPDNLERAADRRWFLHLENIPVFPLVLMFCAG